MNLSTLLWLIGLSVIVFMLAIYAVFSPAAAADMPYGQHGLVDPRPQAPSIYCFIPPDSGQRQC